ncbi:MAG: GWxTD domain-containing protein [bacterium]|nr:GWxTD domain-containing protein [bacterium]
MRSRLIPILALFLVASLTGPVEAKKKNRDSKNLRAWIEGPIRYIVGKDEIKVWKHLETDAQRALFIERFWSRRDPTRETLTNEYRQMFWERVHEANTNFIDAPKDGWLTDRGKIHILYGPPFEIFEDPHMETTGHYTGGRGLIRWTYHGRPGERTDLDPVVIVPFVRDASGEYRLSYDPKLASVFFDEYAMRTMTFSEKRFDQMMPDSQRLHSPLSVMLDLGKMQEVPPQAQVMIERVETLEAYHSHTLVARADRYFHPDEYLPLLVLTLDVTDAGADKPAVMARLTPADATRETRILGEDSFQLIEENGRRLSQARIALEPGEYTVTIVSADPFVGSTGIHRMTVKLPRSPSELLRCSDVVWASALENLRYASLSSYDEPYVVGAFRVVPRFDSVFRPGETLRLFFEIYGARQPVHIDYQIEGLEADGTWVALGKPQTAALEARSHGWEFATNERWPEGQYRVRIDVLDSGERLTTQQVPFTLQTTATPR